jgi:hypothetical protein
VLVGAECLKLVYRPIEQFCGAQRLLRLIVDPPELRPAVYFEADLQRWSNLTAPQSQMTDTDTEHASPRRSRIFSTKDPQFYFDSST